MEPKDDVLEAINVHCQRLSQATGAEIKARRTGRPLAPTYSVWADNELVVQDTAANVDQYLAGVYLGVNLALKLSLKLAETQLAKMKVEV
jgi:hypothetical protein